MLSDLIQPHPTLSDLIRLIRPPLIRCYPTLSDPNRLYQTLFDAIPYFDLTFIYYTFTRIRSDKVG
jgi:hypothetical protein